MPEQSRPEVELLLCCASHSGSVRHGERIRELSGRPLDWEYLFRIASAHALEPLLYWGLKVNRPEVIPEPLAQSFRDNARNSMRLTAELLQLLELFAQEGIAVLPYKGPTLAILAYGNLALRRFGDLDLLVHKEDALRARALLLGKGFENQLPLSPRREKAYLEAYDEFGLSGAGRPLVELHWAVIPRYFSAALDIAPFWKRAIQVQSGQQSIPAPCAEDMFLTLSLHAAKHCWSHLSMVSDLAWLAASCPIDWDDVLGRARSLGILRMVRLAIELTNRLLAPPLPEAVVREAAADGKVRVLADGVIARMLSSAGEPSTIFRASTFHMQARERWQDKMRYFVRLSTTTGVEDWESVDLPPSLAFLYSVFRFPRLMRKYWMRVP